MNPYMVKKINKILTAAVLANHSPLIFCIVRKPGPILLLLVGLMAGRLADKVRVDFEIFRILYRINYLDFHFV